MVNPFIQISEKKHLYFIFKDLCQKVSEEVVAFEKNMAASH